MSSSHSDPKAPANRLAGETSPYLLLHAHNPVDWYPWGEAAFARARAEDKPLFVSVGYATCYWCHVMERESFSDPTIAALMNRHFVNVKVDREERPDVDEIYMAATQILTSQGGWPNSVFLTPDLRPFYAGTYFPPADAYGRPGFGTLVSGLADAWANRRAEVEEQAAELAAVISRYLDQLTDYHQHVHGEGCDHDHDHADEPATNDAAATAAPLSVTAIRDAAARSIDLLARRFDPTWGGFGLAPKFPTPANLLFLLDLARAPDARKPASAALDGIDPDRARTMLATTLDRMLRGGIYDQLAGGFHRYSTDREWRVPHFEKMLYDQGLLLTVYARAACCPGLEPELANECRRVVAETARFLANELTAHDGALWSAIDAETNGHEGAFYVYTSAELTAALGSEDLAFAAPLLGFAEPPFFRDPHAGPHAEATYVLNLPLPLAEQATKRRTTRDALLAELDPIRQKLLGYRAMRPRPATDDKVLADWNGLAIAGLATAGHLLGDPTLTAQAARAASAVLSLLRPAEAEPVAPTLRHAWRANVAKVPGLLGDYASLLIGLLALDLASRDQATAESAEPSRWLDLACDLGEELLTRLGEPDGSLRVAAESPDLLAKSRDLFDGATPSAYGLACLALVELAHRTGDRDLHARAGVALAAAGTPIRQQPEGCRTLVRALALWHDVAGELATDESDSLETADLRPLLAGSHGPSAPPVDLVRATLTVAAAELAEDGWRRFSLRLDIAPGWHLYAPPVTDDPDCDADQAPAEAMSIGQPLRLTMAPPGEISRCRYQPGERFAPSSALPPASVYSGDVVIEGRLRVPEAGGTLEVAYQACDDQRCLLPTTLSLTVS